MRNIVTVFVFAAALTLAACGGDSDSDWGPNSNKPSTGKSDEKSDKGGGESGSNVDSDGFGDYKGTVFDNAEVEVHMRKSSVSNELIEDSEEFRKAAGIGEVHWIKGDFKVTGDRSFEPFLGCHADEAVVVTKDNETIHGNCTPGPTMAADWTPKLDGEDLDKIDITQLSQDWSDITDKEYHKGETGSFIIMFEKPISSVKSLDLGDDEKPTPAG